MNEPRKNGKIMASLKPGYVPLVQRPCCCCVTCLQMILYRRGFGLFDQEGLAKYFRIKVNKKDVDSFNVKLGVYARPVDAGMPTTKSEKAINRFFRGMRIPLRAKSVVASEIPDLEEFLVGNLNKNNDVWVEYKTSRIHGKRQKQKWFRPEWKGPHDNVIECVKKTKKDGTKVVLVDPFWYYRPRNEVDIGLVKNSAIGFVVISGHNRKVRLRLTPYQ